MGDGCSRRQNPIVWPIPQHHHAQDTEQQHHYPQLDSQNRSQLLKAHKLDSPVKQVYSIQHNYHLSWSAIVYACTYHAHTV